jgi:hypothetical protein
MYRAAAAVLLLPQPDRVSVRCTGEELGEADADIGPAVQS